MKAAIDTKALRIAIQQTHAIKPNKTLPILTDTLIDFNDGKATLRSTDLYNQIVVSVDAQADEPFTIVLPRVTASKFLYGGNGITTITAKTPDKTLLTRDQLGTLVLVTNNPNNFPPPIKSDNLNWHTIDAKWFCDMLRIISTACAIELSRPVLNGLSCRDGAIAAADGFRLAILEDNRLDFGLGNSEGIIPLDAVEIIRKLYSKDKLLEIAFEKTDDGKVKLVHLKSDNTTLISQTTLGKYPDYRQLIPKSFDCKVSFSAPLMSQRLNMIDFLLVDGGIIRFDFQKTQKGEPICSIKARAESVSDYAFELPVTFTGNDSKIAFNHKYVLDALKPFSLCQLELTSPSSPGMFTGDIEGLTIVIMPMFVQW